MNRLEILIQKYCPDGVEWKKITEIADTFIGLATSVTKYKVPEGVPLLHNSDIKEGRIELKSIEFLDPVFVQKNSSKILHTDDIITVHTGDVGTSAVIPPDYDGTIGFTTISSRIKDKGIITPVFLCRVLNSSICKDAIASKTISDRNNLNLSSFDELLIPIPPLPVQEEIVRVIDTFTELQAELQTELQEELQKRLQQYNYYRDHLLSFEGRADVEWKKLGDICIKVCSGGTPARGNVEYFTGTIPWLRTQEVNWVDVYDTEIKITEDAVRNSSAKLIPENCVIVAMYGATAAKACINKIPLTTNQACCNLQIDPRQALYKYVFYCVCKEYENLKSLGQGSQNNINAQIVKDYTIPVPSLAEQQMIVDVLDRFDALTTDLAAGLPAEIEKRRQQYDFYRDKLLTFKRKEA